MRPLWMARAGFFFLLLLDLCMAAAEFSFPAGEQQQASEWGRP